MPRRRENVFVQVVARNSSKRGGEGRKVNSFCMVDVYLFHMICFPPLF